MHIILNGPFASIRDALDLAVSRHARELLAGDVAQLEVSTVVGDAEPPETPAWPFFVGVSRHEHTLDLILDSATRTRIEAGRWSVRVVYDVVVRPKVAKAPAFRRADADTMPALDVPEAERASSGAAVLRHLEGR